MAKKQKKSLIGKVAMAAGAVALGMAASPAGQQVTEQAAQLANEGVKTEQVVVKQRMTNGTRHNANRLRARHLGLQSREVRCSRTFHTYQALTTSEEVCHLESMASG